MEMAGSPDDATLASLALRARDGDRAALGALIEQAYPRIRHQLFMLGCYDHHQNEEITQIIAERIVKNIETLKQAQSVIAWIAEITRNCYLNSVRRQNRDRTRQVSIDAHPSPDTLLTDGWHAANQTENSVSIQQALSHLTAKHREIITLRTVQDLTMAEIARMLDISPSAAYQRLDRALKALRAHLSVNPSSGTS